MAVFLVGKVIYLVIFVNERDFSLLNDVKYDSYLITFLRDRSRAHPSHYSYKFYFQTCQLIFTLQFQSQFVFLKRVTRIR